MSKNKFGIETLAKNLSRVQGSKLKNTFLRNRPVLRVSLSMTYPGTYELVYEMKQNTSCFGPALPETDAGRCMRASGFCGARETLICSTRVRVPRQINARGFRHESICKRCVRHNAASFSK